MEVLAVPHTHWDREWYHPAVRFRQRLVALIDDLLAREDASPFLLDGQTIVVDDYVAVRPERGAELAGRIGRGDFTIGPWFVLPDELVPSGEGLVRNLLAARRALERIGAPPPRVLWCPDSFGHPAALPSIAHQFGCDVIVAWRGYGGTRWPAGDTVRWQAPGGEVVRLYHLAPSGYELGASLPSDPASARARWQRIRDALQPRAVAGVVLLPNGADHHALQPAVDAAIAALRLAAAPDLVHRASLDVFGATLVERTADLELPSIQGELRDSYGYTWTLGGTLGSRGHLKRAYARVERELVRDVEPWLALGRYLRRDVPRALLESAWRSLLECQPHDTLCGCSADVVAREMAARLARAGAESGALRDEAVEALLGHDRVRARRRREEWLPKCVVRNPAPRARSGVVEVEIETFLRDVPVGPGSADVRSRAPRAAAPRGPKGVQPIDRFRRYSRIESPLDYPDNDLVEVTKGVLWLDDVPAGGVRSFDLADRPPAVPGAEPAGIRGRTIGNGRLALRIRRDGRITLRDLRERRTIHRVLRFEDARDEGDLYTPSIRGVPGDRARLVGARVRHRGPLRAAIECDYFVLSVRRAPDGTRAIPIRVTITLDAGAPFARFDIRGWNDQRWHRLRLLFDTGIAGGETLADAAFGPVARRPIEVGDEERRMEAPVPTAPLHRWVMRHDAGSATTLFSDGLAEYESLEDGAVAVTLVRAVGALSRASLPERPGHAGWPMATPAAQCRGAFAARFALALHGPPATPTLDYVERLADDVLLPMQGVTLRSALSIAGEVSGFALEGEGLAFSTAKPAQRGEWVVLRCTNVTGTPVSGAWRFPAPPSEARRGRLDETPGDALEIQGTRVPFVAGPREIVTVMARS